MEKQNISHANESKSMEQKKVKDTKSIILANSCNIKKVSLNPV